MYGKVIVMAAVIICLCGCGKKQQLSFSDRIKTEKAGAEMFVEKEFTDEFVALVKSKDVDGMNALFSDYALSEKDYKDDISEFIGFFPDEFTVNNRLCDYYSEDLGGTNIRRVYEGRFRFENKGKKYRVVFVWIKSDPEHPDKQGIHSIQLISEEAREKDKYEIHSLNDKPGVYIYDLE